MIDLFVKPSGFGEFGTMITFPIGTTMEKVKKKVGEVFKVKDFFLCIDCQKSNKAGESSALLRLITKTTDIFYGKIIFGDCKYKNLRPVISDKETFEDFDTKYPKALNRIKSFGFTHKILVIPYGDVSKETKPLQK
jgi:hypothetical protein